MNKTISINSFGKYLRYRIRSTWIILLALSILAALYIVVSFEIDFKNIGIYYGDGSIDYVFDTDQPPDVVYENVPSFSINSLENVLGALCIAAPIIELSMLKYRRRLELLYSFPINRPKLAAAHFTNGAILIAVPYTVAFLTMTLMLFPHFESMDVGYLLPMWCTSLPSALCMYAMATFVFNEGKNIIDSSVFTVIWSILGLELSQIGSYFLGRGIATTSRDLFPSYSFTRTVGYYYIKLTRTPGTTDVDQNPYAPYIVAFWIVLGILCAVGFFLRFSKNVLNETEDTDRIPITYKLLTMLYASLPLILIPSNMILAAALTAILVTLGYMLCRRSVRLKPGDIIWIILTVAVGLILEFIF